MNSTLKDIADLIENPNKKDEDVNKENMELFEKITDWEMAARILVIVEDTPDMFEDEFFDMLKEKYNYDKNSVNRCINEMVDIGLLIWD